MRASTAGRLGWGQELAAAALLAATLIIVIGPPGVQTGPTDWSKAAMPVVLFGYSTVGLLLVARHPTNPIGWILSWAGLVGLTGEFALRYAEIALNHGTGDAPAGDVAAWLAFWTPPAATLPLLTFGFLLFPDGRLPSPRWRPLAWAAGASTATLTIAHILVPGPLPSRFPVANPFGVEAIAFDTLTIVSNVSFAVCLACVVASLISMPVRLRGLRGRQRTQLVWVIAGAASVAVAAVAGGLLDWLADVTTPAVPPLAMGTLLVAFGVAIVRHRLYDSDIVLWRIVVIASVAGFTTVTYVALVAGIGNAVPTAWPDNLLLPAAATALVAVAAQPVWWWARSMASRLVYGTPATPYQALSEFSRTMAGTAWDQLLPHMARLLTETTGAARAAVWLAVDNELRCAASWPAWRGATRVALAAGLVPDIPGSTHTVAVHHHGELLGALTVGAFAGERPSPAERLLLADLAKQAGLALRNVRLITELKASRIRIVAAQDAQRRRLERDIHDGAQQRLVALSLALRVARARTDPSGRLHDALADAEGALGLAMVELQELARGIHPAILTDEGLGPTIHALVERSPVPTTVATVPRVRLASAVEATACSFVSQALADVASVNASWAAISTSHVGGLLTIEVRHNGPLYSPRPGGDPITDRLSALDGRLAVETRADGEYLIRAVIPAEPLECPASVRLP